MVLQAVAGVNALTLWKCWLSYQDIPKRKSQQSFRDWGSNKSIGHDLFLKANHRDVFSFPINIKSNIMDETQITKIWVFCSLIFFSTCNLYVPRHFELENFACKNGASHLGEHQKTIIAWCCMCKARRSLITSYILLLLGSFGCEFSLYLGYWVCVIGLGLLACWRDCFKRY